MKTSNYKPSVSNEAVKKATGRTWSEWFRILDNAGAKKLPHPEIAEWLEAKKKVSSWWSQMVTVEYEYARGLRSKVIKIPAALGQALRANKTAKDFFNSLPPSHRREYAEWVAEAKKPETRARRVKQAIVMLLRKKRGR